MDRLVQCREMRRLSSIAAGVALTAWAATACVPLSSFLVQGATETLAPWRTSTATRVPATPAPTVAATSELGPSPTPFKHVVEKNETLLQIAALYGVSLDALLALNPGLNPTVLSIGQELLIPGPGGEPIVALIPTSTPIPLELQPPSCYRRPSVGVWCLTAVRNPSTQDLENLVVEIRLEGASGSILHSTQVFPPLNLLRGGQIMPMAAAFPETAGSEPHALVLGVIPANDVDNRYRTPTIVRTTDRLQEGGLSWITEGTIALPPDAMVSNRTLILATALDDAHRVIGYAVWEADPTMQPGEVRPFAMRVFSLGPPIARVEVSAESYALADESG